MLTLLRNDPVRGALLVTYAFFLFAIGFLIAIGAP